MAVAEPGQRISIREEFAPSAEFSLVLDVREDGFDPSSAEEGFDGTAGQPPLQPTMNVPTEAEWSDWPPDAERSLDLDEDYARRRFSGKTAEEALQLFRDNVLSAAEDVGYMPPVPFRFYMLVFKAHALAQIDDFDSRETASAASCFLSLIERKLRTERMFIVPIMSDLMPAADFIAGNQERYDADRDIFGDFREQVSRIQLLWEA